MLYKGNFVRHIPTGKCGEVKKRKTRGKWKYGKATKSDPIIFMKPLGQLIIEDVEYNFTRVD